MRQPVEKKLELTPTLVAELRAIAARELAGERAGHTLQPTALINEAWLKLARRGGGVEGAGSWDSRAHFIGAAARAMREVLVDYARQHQRAKRGGGKRPLPLTVVADLERRSEVDLLELDRALTDLAGNDESMARVVELRFFGGLSGREIAALLGFSTRTVDRLWQRARLWLYNELQPQ